MILMMKEIIYIFMLLLKMKFHNFQFYVFYYKIMILNHYLFN